MPANLFGVFIIIDAVIESSPEEEDESEEHG